MSNALQLFRQLLPERPVQLGTVTAMGDGVALVQLPTGEAVQVRGAAAVSSQVFFRDGAVEGPAPNMPVVSISL